MKMLMVFLATASVALAQSNIYPRVKVTGDNVSIRPVPSTDCEVLDRAMHGEEFLYIDQTNGWMAVQAPSNLNFWVFGEYIENGVVLPKKLNVRAGPSQNYRVVTILLRDEELNVRGEFNGWLKIEPPKGSRVWISADFTELIQKPKPKIVPEPVAVSEPEVKKQVVAEVNEESNAETPAFLMTWDKTRKQGNYDEYPGIIRRATPGLYKLVLKTETFEETICLIKGDPKQMEEYLNYPVLLKGKIYWVKDVDVPVMIPDYIIPNPILSE